MAQTFGQLIRQARKDKGYSQRELAKLVELDFTYLSKLENDRADYPPKEYVIQQLAHYLELNKEDMQKYISGPIQVREMLLILQNKLETGSKTL